MRGVYFVARADADDRGVYCGCGESVGERR